MTITVEGREYEVTEVEPRSEGEAELNSGRTIYELVGKRGARYRTMRNHKRPQFMFLVNVDFPKGAPKAWLTDEGGPLRQI